MTKDQVMGIVRAVVPAIAAFVAGKGWLGDTSAVDLTAALTTIVAAVWSVWSKRQAK